jgi:penicillin-binding protein 1A
MEKIINLKNTLVIKTKLVFKFVRIHPFKSFFYLIGIGFIFSILFLLMIYFGVFGKLPTKEYLLQLENPVTSTIYASNNEPIGYYFLQNRSNADSTQISKYLKDALVATEDSRFYTHGGIDYKSYGRVFVKSIVLGQNAGGGSTVTQQVAKNIFGRQKQFFLSTPINKIRELFIARRLESIYSKDEILLLYFNTVSFGENIYGIEKAAYRFFNKPPEKLSLEECATLVGVLKAPSYYNPRINPERATTRRNVVLSQMEKYGYITSEQKEASKKPLVLEYQLPKKTSAFSSYFKDLVAEEFAKWADDNPAEDGHVYNLEADGLSVYTTLNTSIQEYAEKALNIQIENLQGLMDQYWDAATIEGGKEALLKILANQTNELKKLKAEAKSDDELAVFLREKKKRKYWQVGKGYENIMMSLEDSIAKSINRLHASLFVMSSTSGRIMGYVGGIDYGFSQTDNIRTPRQVGSTFKPITYLAALEAGQDVCSYYNNNLVTYEEYEDWQPRNAAGGYGGSYSMHGALAASINTVSVSIQLKTGVDRVLEQAKKMGITTALPEVPSIVLGTADISLLEMVTAYASISNGGNKVKPFTIERIINEEGVVVYEAKPEYEGRVAGYTHVKQLQKMMEGVVRNGTAIRLTGYGIPYNLIGKTGTTQNNGDGWFIGASPEVVIGAWVGTYDKRVQFSTTRMGSGSHTALPMVAAVFRDLSTWRKPILTNFKYDFDYFPCPPYLEMNAKEAFEFAKTDTLYIQNLRIQDSLKILSQLPVPIDSLQGIVPATMRTDSTILDSLPANLGDLLDN